MQIRAILKSLYTSTEVQGLGDQIVSTIEDSPLQDQIVIQALLDPLRESLASLAQSRGHSRHNTQTERIEEADLARDNAFRAFWMMIEAGVRRQNEPYRQAAVKVMSHMEAFDRRLYTFGYDRQSTLLKDFVAILEKPEVDQAIQQMQMQGWREEIKSAQTQFDQIYENKIDEETQKQALVPTKKAREQVLAQLTALTQTMNGLLLSGQEVFKEVNPKIDQLIEEYESKAKARRTRRQNEGAAENEVNDL